MSDQVRASNARAVGNYGLWETLRRNPDADHHGVEDENLAVADSCKSRLPAWRGRAIRWSLAGGVFLAYVNHWPGGH